MTLLLKTLRDQRGQIVGFGLANISMALLVSVLYPSYSNQLSGFEIPPALRAILGDVAGFDTAAGFLSAEFFSWIPVLIITYAIIQGTGAIAGEEAACTLDLLLAQPIARSRIVIVKSVALGIGIAVIAGSSLIGFGLARPFVDLDITWLRFAFAVLGMIPISLFYGTFAIWMSTLLPNRSLAAMASTAFVVVGYFLNALGRVATSIDSIRVISPFKYYPCGTLLTGDEPWWDLPFLTGLAVLFVIFAVIAFKRRDISIGRREWSPPWRSAAT